MRNNCAIKKIKQMNIDDLICDRWHKFCQTQNRLRKSIHSIYNGQYPLNDNRLVQTSNTKNVNEFMDMLAQTEDTNIASAYITYMKSFQKTYEKTFQTKKPIYRMYHMYPSVPSMNPEKNDIITFNHFSILKTILQKDSTVEPIILKQEKDRTIMKIYYRGNPVILKRQIASTRTSQQDEIIQKKMYYYYVNRSQDEKNDEDNYINKIHSLLDRSDIESLTEAYNGTIMNNINCISPIFPYLYHAAFDFVLDDVGKKIIPFVVQVQEYLGDSVQDLIENINDKSLRQPNLNQNNYILKKQIYNSMIMQILFSFMTAQKIMDFVHFDLRLPNITYEKTNLSHINYMFNKKLYRVPTNGYLFHVIDFGRSYVNTGDFQTGTQMYTTNYENNSRDINGKSLDYADILLFTTEFLYRGDTLFIDEVQHFDQNYDHSLFYNLMKDALTCDREYEKLYPENRNCKKQLNNDLKSKGMNEPFSNFHSCIVDTQKHNYISQKLKNDPMVNQRDVLTQQSIDYKSKIAGSFVAFYPFALAKHCHGITSVHNMLEKYGTLFEVDQVNMKYIMDRETVLMV